MKIINYIKNDFNLVEIFKGGSVAFVFKVGSIGIGYFFYFFLARFFDAEVVGIFSVCWTVLMIGAVLAKVGLDTSIVRFISESVANKKNSYIKNLYFSGLSIVSVSSIIVFVLISIFSKQLSNFYFESAEKYKLIIVIAITVIPMSIMSFNAESVRGLKKITQYSYFQSGSILLLTLIFIFVIYFSAISSDFIFPSLGISIFLLMIFSFFIIKFSFKNFSKEKSATFKKDYPLKKMLSVSLPMLLTNSLFLILNWTDIQMLSVFTDEASVGIYNIAVKIAALNVVGLTAINSIASPKFAELYSQNDKSGLRKIIKQTTLINTLISLPIFIAIIAIPNFLLHLFGEEFEVGKSALIILGVGQFFSAFSGSAMHILNMTGKEKTGRNIIFFATVLNIVLNYILIPKYGIMGAAIATMTSTIIWKTLAVIYIYKYHKILTYPFKIR